MGSSTKIVEKTWEGLIMSNRSSNCVEGRSMISLFKGPYGVWFRFYVFDLLCIHNDLTQ